MLWDSRSLPPYPSHQPLLHWFHHRPPCLQIDLSEQTLSDKMRCRGREGGLGI
ncbi:hypothetical protein LINPERHAP2_LOCUS4597 [Linum perenne]